MVIENDEPLRSDIVTRLEGMGYRVMKVLPSAEKAISLFNQPRPDIILIDIDNTDDKDVFGRAKEINENYNLPIVFLISEAGKAVFESAMRAGTNSFVMKPVREKDLAFKIELTLLKHRKEMEFLQTYQELLDERKKLEILINIRNEALANISDNIRTQTVDASNAIDKAMKMAGRKDKKDLSKAKEALRNQILLVEDLIDNMRIAEDEISISTSVFDLDGLVSNAVEELRPKAGGIGIKVSPREGKVMVNADYYKIKYVTSVLLKHALNLSGKKGELGVEVNVKEGLVRVSIRDLSRMIEFEGQEGLFEKRGTEQGDGSEPEKAKKLLFQDVDLYGIKDIVSAHKGEVGVDGSSEEGVAYYFLIPEASKGARSDDRYGSDVDVERLMDRVSGPSSPNMK